MKIIGFQHCPDGLAPWLRGLVFQNVSLKVLARFLTLRSMDNNTACRVVNMTLYKSSGAEELWLPGFLTVWP